MPSLEIDLANPKPTAAIAWVNGTPVKLTDVYPNEPSAALISFASSPNVKSPEIYFDGGLVLQTARADSDNLGEVFGLFFKLDNANQHDNSIRVEVQFDVLEVLEQRTPVERPFWLARLFSRIIRVPMFRPGGGLGWREVRLPASSTVVNQYIGGFAACITAADMSAGVITEATDKMAVGNLYLLYNPNGDANDPQNNPIIQSMRIGSSKFFSIVSDAFQWVSFVFLKGSLNYPISKLFDPFAGAPWSSNPFDPYKFELLLEAPKKKNEKAPMGVALTRTLDGVALENDATPDTSRFQSLWFSDDLGSARFAGVNLVIGKFPGETALDPPSPPRNFGPTRMRIKKLKVEYS